MTNDFLKKSKIKGTSPTVSENALRSVPGVMYWAAWQEQVGPHALRHAISAYVDAHNDEGKPFKWTKTGLSLNRCGWVEVDGRDEE